MGPTLRPRANPGRQRPPARTSAQAQWARPPTCPSSPAEVARRCLDPVRGPWFAASLRRPGRGGLEGDLVVVWGLYFSVLMADSEIRSQRTGEEACCLMGMCECRSGASPTSDDTTGRCRRPPSSCDSPPRWRSPVQSLDETPRQDARAEPAAPAQPSTRRQAIGSGPTGEKYLSEGSDSTRRFLARLTRRGTPNRLVKPNHGPG